MELNLTTDKIVEILKEIKEPETGISLFDLSLIKYVDYQKENKALIVKCDFIRRNPTCVGCVPIAWFLQKKITDELSKRLMKFKDVESVEFIP